MTMHFAPIKVRTVTPEEADKVSRVVAFTGCTRGTAFAYLQAEDGDVADACESWRVDHRHYEIPAFSHRVPMSMEASD